MTNFRTFVMLGEDACPKLRWAESQASCIKEQVVNAKDRLQQDVTGAPPATAG